MPLNIFIYRPDIRFHPNVNPDCVYTLKGQPYREWQRDREELYNYKVSEAKKRLNHPKSDMVLDYWR